jgi:hypothetical protein
LIDRRRHSSILHVRNFRVADCDTENYLEVTTVREKLAVRKQSAKTLVGEIYNLRKLHELELRKQYHIEILHRFAVLETLNDSEEINRA